MQQLTCFTLISGSRICNLRYRVLTATSKPIRSWLLVAEEEPGAAAEDEEGGALVSEGNDTLQTHEGHLLEEERRASGKAAGPSDARTPVWEDPEDEALEVNIAAFNRLRKLRASEAETTLTGMSHTPMSIT